MVRLIGPALVTATLSLAPALVSATEAVVTATVNLRSGPGTIYQRAAVLPRGSVVHLHACHHAAPWCMVSLGHVTGWAASGYLQTIRPYALAPVMPLAGALSPVVVHPSVVPVAPPVFGLPAIPQVVHGAQVETYGRFGRWNGGALHYRQVTTEQWVLQPPSVVVHPGLPLPYAVFER